MGQDLSAHHILWSVDFFSLDVEGSELGVLRGMDWSIRVHVLLIESVTGAIRTFLQARGFRRHSFASRSRLNEIWVNEGNRRPSSATAGTTL